MHLKATLKLLPVLLVTGLACPLTAAFEQGALVVWISNDNGVEGLREVARRYTADTGVRVIVQTQDGYAGDEDPADRFDRAATTTDGPDIIFGAHDRIGHWINEDLLQPVTPSLDVYKQIHDFAWDAVMVGHAIYGYPIAMDAISLIYNKDLISRPPELWTDVIRLDRDLRRQGNRALHYPYADPYFSWPLLTSAGAYSFRKDDRVYQLDEVGLDTRGALKGMTMLNRLYQEGVIEAGDGADRDAMIQDFTDGRVAMTINGPRIWDELNDSGVDWGLAEFPKIDGNSGFGRPFTGILAGYINGFSPNTAAAEQFLEDYVVVYEGVKTIHADRPLAAAANRKLQSELGADPLNAHTFALAEKGETLPDIPEMKRFWEVLQGHLQQMVLGDIPIETTMTDIAQKLRRLDRMKVWTRKHYLAAPDAGDDN